ncbi:MAG: polysulfide reductase [Gemmatimonadetes bacterium]|nr:polysulfide reductase [Gemmatimonadota bacterium]
MVSGSAGYYAWLAALSIVILGGVWGYSQQIGTGLAVTGMTDQVSWGIYIANFTFLVGVAAAAVMMVIPGYLYDIKAVKGGVLIGEMVAIGAIVMCLLFVVVDLGRPDRMWHLIPGIGRFHFPISMLSWDVLVLNGYLLLNLHIPGYTLYQRYLGRSLEPKFYMPFVYLSVAWAISIHTVTAFLYNGLVGRPFWNTAILAPRFIASAFTAGPAFIILVLHVVRRFTDFDVKEEMIRFLRMVVLVCGVINLFLLGSDVFTEFYSDSAHGVSARYLYFGLEGYNALVGWIWCSITMNIAAILMLLTRRFEERGIVLENLPLVLLIVAIWIEKGMGLIVPGFIPTPLSEVFEYQPSVIETLVSLAIWAFGLLVMTLLIKFATDVEGGRVSASKRF